MEDQTHNFITICAQYLLGADYTDQVGFVPETEILVSTKRLPKLWDKLLGVEHLQTESGFIIKGPQYFGWVITKMAVKAALETNDLTFLEVASKELILPYEKQFFDFLKEKFPEDVAEYTLASLTSNGLCYARTSLFVSKIEDHRSIITPGIIAGVEGSKQYVEVSYTSPMLWDYYFATEYFTIQDILADPTYTTYKNLLLISLKA
ncbi:hypothetical protein [Yersinia ruckeri]|uniref:hypothetical protein n=1 Tax=Yersinia ruckeri TaxID=29486 RepID=UPI002238296C|nr:hypothetical protein [Yersinia ruckeri]MCW6598770.1 hypothetical protein [Yersinia ruckeri]